MKPSLFDLIAAISCLMEQTKKEPTPQVVRMPRMARVNLPRIKIQTFDGNILTWQLFWEQFQATVHNKLQLEEVDKLMYLQNALKDGPARNVIQGLTEMAESYQEDVKCLKDCYNHPRLTHCEHVWSILQAPPLKVNNGRELCKLHDLCNQHIRAIKVSDNYDIDTFLTNMMELKLDEVTKLKWMEYSNESQMTPKHAELLKFLDLQAQHFESMPSELKS